jgi:GT2 family glycosyltransferase
MLPVSIIIPTFNREHLLKRFLPTYLGQKCAEIIIVNDSPTCKQSIDDGLAGYKGVKILHNSKRLYQPASRMIGVNRASQPYIFFGEDDVYLTSGYVENLYSYVNSGTAEVVAGTLVNTKHYGEEECDNLPVAEGASDIVDRSEVRIFADRRATRPIFVPHLHSIALMRKSVIDELPFDPMYTGNSYREETDFYLRAYSSGVKIAFVPGPPAFHYKGPDNFGGGQHRKAVFTGLLWYEYYAARNNFRFLRKNSLMLKTLSLPSSPAWGTAMFLLRRVHGYPGRLKAALIAKMKTTYRRRAGAIG